MIAIAMIILAAAVGVGSCFYYGEVPNPIEEESAEIIEDVIEHETDIIPPKDY